MLNVHFEGLDRIHGSAKARASVDYSLETPGSAAAPCSMSAHLSLEELDRAIAELQHARHVLKADREHSNGCSECLADAIGKPEGA